MFIDILMLYWYFPYTKCKYFLFPNFFMVKL